MAQKLRGTSIYELTIWNYEGMSTQTVLTIKDLFTVIGKLVRARTYLIQINVSDRPRTLPSQNRSKYR